MAVAPDVITERWVRDSIAAKTLLRAWLLPFVYSIVTGAHSYPKVRACGPRQREEMEVQSRRCAEARESEQRPTIRRLHILRDE
jgi:hypothetical protein